MDSILTSIKKLLGIESDITHFDPDITFHINTALMFLTQIGVGPTTGYLITSAAEKWTDFLGDRKDMEGVKLYIQAKVRLAFDPPTNSFLVDAMERQIKELEWRLNVIADPYIPTIVEGGTVIE